MHDFLFKSLHLIFLKWYNKGKSEIWNVCKLPDLEQVPKIYKAQSKRKFNSACNTIPFENQKENTDLNVYDPQEMNPPLERSSSVECEDNSSFTAGPFVWCQLLGSYSWFTAPVWLASSSEPRNWLHSSIYTQNQLPKIWRPTICQVVDKLLLTLFSSSG